MCSVNTQCTWLSLQAGLWELGESLSLERAEQIEARLAFLFLHLSWIMMMIVPRAVVSFGVPLGISCLGLLLDVVPRFGRGKCFVKGAINLASSS